jgi:hypothetical protein
MATCRKVVVHRHQHEPRMQSKRSRMCAALSGMGRAATGATTLPLPAQTPARSEIAQVDNTHFGPLRGIDVLRLAVQHHCFN